jgi:hypothetical protein
MRSVTICPVMQYGVASYGRRHANVAYPCRWGNSRLAETVRETLVPGPNINLAAPPEASNYQGEAS